jgi:hypothetical protein
MTETTEDDSTTSAVGGESEFIFQPSENSEASPTINVQLVFDASGSMAEDIGGETKIDAARRAMEKCLEPTSAGLGTNRLDADQPGATARR